MVGAALILFFLSLVGLRCPAQKRLPIHPGEVTLVGPSPNQPFGLLNRVASTALKPALLLRDRENTQSRLMRAGCPLRWRRNPRDR